MGLSKRLRLTPLCIPAYGEDAAAAQTIAFAVAL